MEDIKSSSGKGNEKKTFTFSKDVDGIKKTVRGEEVENGWIVTIDKEWHIKDPITDATDYKYECKKYISKDNPMDKFDEDGKKDDKQDLISMFTEINKAQGLISV